jgi:hypothetical protein
MLTANSDRAKVKVIVFKNESGSLVTIEYSISLLGNRVYQLRSAPYNGDALEKKGSFF